MLPEVREEMMIPELRQKIQLLKCIFHLINLLKQLFQFIFKKIHFLKTLSKCNFDKRREIIVLMTFTIAIE